MIFDTIHNTSEATKKKSKKKYNKNAEKKEMIRAVIIIYDRNWSFAASLSIIIELLNIIQIKHIDNKALFVSNQPALRIINDHFFRQNLNFKDLKQKPH